MAERLPNIGMDRASRTSEKMRLRYKEEKMTTRIPAPVAAAGTALAVGALLATGVLLLFLGPIILMWATDFLHNTYPVVPELSFVNSLLAIIIARTLVGGRTQITASK